MELLQEAYRGSRILPENLQRALDVTPKTHLVLIDFLDLHEPALEGMARKRMEIYRKQGWAIHEVESPAQIDWEKYSPTNHSEE